MAESKISTGVSLSSDFFLKNFYKYNRNAFKNSLRNDYNQSELSYEDTRALKRALSKLSSFDYSEADNADNIVNSIKAFVKTYNYTIESTDSESSEMHRQNRQLKALTQKYGKDLKDIGVVVEDNGTLSIREGVLKETSVKELRNVFSTDSDYVRSIRTIAKRMNNASYDEVYAQMTGAGGRLNIIL